MKMTFLRIAITCLLLPVVLSQDENLFEGGNVDEENGCTHHAYASCDENAKCNDLDLEHNIWECVCLFGLDGDGLQTGTGCTGEKICGDENDCHPRGECIAQKCFCQTGFEGDGWHECLDIDECSENLCHTHAVCENTPGSFFCKCDESTLYFGNGFECTKKCTQNFECASTEICSGGTCVCGNGYEGEPGFCQDIDECIVDEDTCSEFAVCKNTIGSVECECTNGYMGDGFTCELWPRNCHEVKISKPKSKNGLYMVDPDGIGPLLPIEVQCEMRPTFGITILRMVSTRPKKFTRRSTTKTYDYVNGMPEIQAIIGHSGYCFQYMKYQGYDGAVLLDGDDYWEDAQGQRQYTWGGLPSEYTGMCECGFMGYCRDRSYACNNDGGPETAVDDGKIREGMPITKVVSNPGPLPSRGWVTINPVKCAPEPFDIPRSCHEAKFNKDYRVRQDGPLLVDFDGPGGELLPQLVHCDMTSHKDQGITVVPTFSTQYFSVQIPGENDVSYVITDDAARKLKEISEFCSQEAGVMATNSRLLNNLSPKYGWITTLDGDALDYFPGGLGIDGSCGCDITGTCFSDDFGCNCDVVDNVTRTDYGMIYNKADLPIGSVTLMDLGGSAQSASYYVGPFMCGGGQFGIPQTCQVYAQNGYTEDHTLPIDPDGPGGVDPFPAYCDFEENQVGGTIIYPDTNQYNVTVSGQYVYSYLHVSVAQLIALTTRAVTCRQYVSYSCFNAKIHASNGEAIVTWESPTQQQLEVECACALTSPSSCNNGGQCNCDAGGSGTDEMYLTEKSELPVMVAIFDEVQDLAEVTVGPLECKELFPSCAEMGLAKSTTEDLGEMPLESGYYPIDPDGDVVGGVEPFIVECIKTQTVITVETTPTGPTDGDPDEGVSICYDISYKSNGIPITPEQVQALVDIPGLHCAQELSQTCINAPLISHSNFTTCDGESQTGWAGAAQTEMCGCGVTGTCDGGPEVPCHCETEDGQERFDGGKIIDSERLAVCQVCVSLDPISDLPPDVEPKMRRVTPFVSDLICAPTGLGSGKSCQDWRNQGMTESGTVNVGDQNTSPIYCNIQVYPPMGSLELFPKNPTTEAPETEVTITVEYHVYKWEYMIEIIETSTYCTQEFWIHCDHASVDFEGEYGWYSRNGEVQNYWPEPEDGSAGCAGGQCFCDGSSTGSDGGKILDKTLLPITQIKLGPSSSASGNRTVEVGPLKCFDLPLDCEDIRKNFEKNDPMGNGTYVIDPSGAGGQPPFAVKCDFRTDRKRGVTIVRRVKPSDDTVTNRTVPGGYEVPIEYVAANYEQIHELAIISGFCLQELSYECYLSPLINFGDAQSYYLNYGGVPSQGWGVAGSPSLEGCACLATNTCPTGYSCRCDKLGHVAIDRGYHTYIAGTPIQQLNFGGQWADDANARFTIGPVMCSPKAVGLPKTCHEAYRKGGLRWTGDVLLQPNWRVNPFLAYCDFDRVPSGGVTIIKHKLEPNTDVNFGSWTDVEYYDASTNQLKWLTRISKYCYQPFCYYCTNTKILETEGLFAWKGSTYSTERTFIGNGIDQCNCGEEELCGGSENKTTLMGLNRKCNCDAADDQPRADCGVFNQSLALPVTSLTSGLTGLTGSEGSFKLGDLYCSDIDFDLDECHLGFHDCHEHATCINHHGYFECRCNNGWRAYGRDEEDLWANGRNCYDDNECNMNLCPWSSDCFNTPGSYNCVCKGGFTQTGKRHCRDNDECTLGTHNCDDNARCINLIGSYECVCDRGFIGDGLVCEPQAICACFGDPHCLTYDNYHLDYQGQCQYVMSRDNCGGGEPTFSLLATFSDRPDIVTLSEVTWVKEVQFNVYNYSIELLEGHRVLVNGYLVYLPYVRPDLDIRLVGRFVEVTTPLGIEVRWDGDQTVEIRTPGQYKTETCGLCGNYNDDPTDDRVVGPACPEFAGSETESGILFGNSWVVPSYTANHPTCVANCTEVEEPVPCEDDPVRLLLMKLICGTIWNVNGPFKECLKVMDYEVIQVLFDACVSDLCAMECDASVVLCPFAEDLIKECSSSYGVILVDFPIEDFCHIDCDDNMEYTTCGPVNQVTCYDTLTGVEPVLNGTSCVEGCFCVEGYVFDNNKCVLPDECGCLLDGDYMEADAVATLDDCGTEVTCHPGGDLTYSDISCHEFATCKLKNGNFGCHCNEGYYGDGVEECHEDKCLNGPCGMNETCLRDSAHEEGYICVCSMGFMGDCGSCEDINECLTATDNCVHNAKCTNTIGSFVCECYEGFTFVNNQCIDINECKLGGSESLCGNNSKCSNIIGAYECPCCYGFVRDGYGECVEVAEGTEGSEGPLCCVCTIAICDKPGKVCGEDGIEYDSVKDMIIQRCERGIAPKNQVKIDYYGKCQSSCGKVDCPRYQICIVDEKTGYPTCVCESCNEPPETVPEPVCSDELVKYESRCQFEFVQCMMDLDDILLSSMDPCIEANGGGPVSPWSDWSPCSVTCGKGLQTKTRNAYQQLSQALQEEYSLVVSADCYMDPCLDGPCAGYTCEGLAEECKVEGGEAVCECPSCENIGVEPVCGYVVVANGPASPGTWKSACTLQKFACEHSVDDYQLMHVGECGVRPKNCTRVPHLVYLKDPADRSYMSDTRINVYDCQGGCGLIRDDCCQHTVVDYELINLYNSAGDMEPFNATIIKECDCIDIIDID